MARTPLFRALRRHARLAAGRVHPAPPAPDPSPKTGLGCDRPRRLSRRAFLASSTMLAGVAAGAGCASLGRRSPAAPQVVVVGAGLAGLTTAYRLVRAGISVRIFEAQSRVGGRCFSLRGRFADDQVVELGGELIDSNHRNVRALAREFGLLLNDLEALEGPSLDRVTWYFGGRRYTDAEVVAAFAPLSARLGYQLHQLPDDVTYRSAGGSSGSTACQSMTG